MIVISGVLVVLALVLLIAGVVADSLTLIYLSIATSAVSFLSLVFGVRQRKDEALPGASREVGASSAAGAASPASAARTGGSVALLERLDPSGGQAERSAPSGAPSLADTAAAGSAFRDGARGEDHPAAGAVPTGPEGRQDQPEDEAARVEPAEEAGEDDAVAPVVYEAVEVDPADAAGGDLGDEEYDDYEAYEEEASEGVVLVINGRPRYHVEGCRFVAGKEAEAIAVEDAREEGFTACGVCRPDEALAAAAELYDEEDLEDEELVDDEGYDEELLDEEGYAEDEYDDEQDESEGAETAAPVGVPAEVAVVPGQTLTVVGAEPTDAGYGDEEAYAEDEHDDLAEGDEDGYAEDEYDEDDEDGYAEDEDDDEVGDVEGEQPSAEPEPSPSDALVGTAPEPPPVAAPVRPEPVPDAAAATAPEAVPARSSRARRLAAAAAAEPATPQEPAPTPPEPLAPTGTRPSGARRSRASRVTAPTRPASTRSARSTSPAAAPSPVPESVPAPAPRASARGRVVVIPDRGRYHRAECRYVRESPDAIEITKNRATKQGYVPCGVCKP